MSETSKTTGEFVIRNELGLHFRAAAMVVRTLKDFDAKVSIANGATTADAASVLDLLTLAATKGTTVHVSAEGPDAPGAVAALERLIARNFAE